MVLWSMKIIELMMTNLIFYDAKWIHNDSFPDIIHEFWSKSKGSMGRIGFGLLKSAVCF